MNSFYSFLKNPVWIPKVIVPDFKSLIQLYIFYLVMLFPLALLAYLVCSITGIVHKSPGLNSINEILLIILLAPIYEEIFFRSLLRFKKINFVLFISVLILILGYGLYSGKVIFCLVATVLLVTALVLYYVFNDAAISKFVSEHIKGLYYLTSILFGLLHVVNFTGDTWTILVFSVILCGPQIVVGLMLGYIRIMYGLFYSILFHVLINMSILLNI